VVPIRPWRALAWMAAGALLTLVAMGAVGLLVVEDGLFSASAVTPHGAFLGWATHTTMIHSVARSARDAPAPRRFSQAQVAQGFRLYDRHCAMCHGGPGLPRESWTRGLSPTPPYLLDAARRWTPAQLKVIVADGVKMTAMPAWSLTLGEAETWDLVAFLEALPYLSAADYQAMRRISPYRCSISFGQAGAFCRNTGIPPECDIGRWRYNGGVPGGA